MKKNNLKPIPKFKNEDEERDFWAKADSSEYFDMDNPIKLDLSKLKPTTESISLRLPGYLLSRIKEIANIYRLLGMTNSPNKVLENFRIRLD